MHACTFNACKISKLACAHTVAHNFGVHRWASEHTRMRDASHELAFGLPHYMIIVFIVTICSYSIPLRGEECSIRN